MFFFFFPLLFVAAVSSQSPSPPPTSTPAAPAAPTNNCIPLADSVLCPEYKSWLIPSEFLYNNQYYVRSVADFDHLTRLLFLQLDVDSVQTKQKCPAFKFAFQPRYRITLICSLLLNRPEVAKCTPESRRRLVCPDTCYASMQNLQKDVLDNPQICPPADRANASSLCPKISANSSTECVLGVKNEPKTCGFLLPEQNEKACRYCLDVGGKDDCCNELPDDVVQCVKTSGQATFWSNSNTATAVSSNKLLIGVLIIAGLGWLGLMGLVVWYVKSKREQQAYADRVGAASVYSLARMASAPPIATENPTIVYPPPVYSEKSPHTSRPNSSAQKKKLPSPLMTSSDCSSVASSGSALSSLDSPSHASSLNSPASFQNTPALYVVRYSYDPQLPDELGLEEGRTLQVLRIFDDGWAIGLDPDTGREGVFPLACVEPFRVMPPPPPSQPPPVATPPLSSSPKPPPSPPLLSVTDVDASDDGYVHRAPRRASSLVPPENWTTVVTSPVIAPARGK